MRRTAVEMGALAALLLGGFLANGQPAAPPAATSPPTSADKQKDAPAKSKLEEMLQQALQNNPDLRLAAAKVAEAEAELNRARLLVVQKVGAAYQAVEAQKGTVELAEAELGVATKTPTVPAGEQQRLMGLARQKLIDAKAKLAALETELPYLVGKSPANITTLPAGAAVGAALPGMGGFNPGGLGALGGSYIGGFSGAGMGQLGGGFGALGAGLSPQADPDAPKPVPVLGKTAERIRAALDKPYSLDLKKTKLSAVIAEVSGAFQKANPGLLIKCNISPDQLDSREVENVQFDKMPIGAVLVWIGDSVPGSGVVVRDYGLVIDMNNDLPPGAPSLHEFWKEAGEEKPPAKDQPSHPPAEQVEGVVKSVDPAGLVNISLGSDAGIAKGNTLEVYRLNAKAPEQSKYLGRIKIVGATATSAVGQPMGKMVGTIQVGDQVSSRILGD